MALDEKIFVDRDYLAVELAKKANSSHGTHVTWSTTTPKANGTASVGSEAKVARGDHVHPLQTTISGNAGSATKVNNNLVIKFNSGSTEGTNMFTFNGSAAKTVNITPGNIGAAAASHGNHVPATQTANNAIFLRNDNSWATITPANIGAAASSHTHSYAATNHTHNYAGSSSAGGAANSVKTNLVIKLNSGTTEGTNMFTFNGSAAKSINITPSAIGAAASSHTHSYASSSHTHNYAGSSSAGGAATSANKVNTNLVIKLNSGSTEGTNLFTFNGSAAKTVNITPSAIGAATSSHTHSGYAASSHTHTAVNGITVTKLTQAAYNSATKNANTLYIIVG